MAKHYCIFSVKSELDQMLCGLSSTLGMLDLLRNNPTVMRPLFVSSNACLVADNVYDAFEICFSPEGSNKRQSEEATIMQWVHFLQNVEREFKTLWRISLSFQVVYYYRKQGVSRGQG